MDSSSVQLSWQWTSSGSAPNCFNTTSVTYHPKEGGESFLQLSDPAATEATLTDFQCSINYTITVVTTAGEHKKEVAAFFLLQGMLNACMEACAYYETCACCRHMVFITLLCRITKCYSVRAVFHLSVFDMVVSLQHTPI